MTDLVYGIEFGATHAALVIGEGPGGNTGIGDPEPIGSEIPARVLGLLRVRAQARVPGTPAMVVIALPASWEGQRRVQMVESAVAAGFDRAKIRVETSEAAVAALGPGPSPDDTEAVARGAAILARARLEEDSQTLPGARLPPYPQAEPTQPSSARLPPVSDFLSGSAAPPAFAPATAAPQRRRLPLVLSVVAGVAVIAVLVGIAAANSGPSSDSSASPSPGYSSSPPASPSDSPSDSYSPTPYESPSPEGLSVVDPSPTPEYGYGQEQAEAIDDLLDESASSRSGLSSAISDLSACRDMDSALSTVSSIGEDRDSQASTARDLEVDALDDGESLQGYLVEFLEASASADEAFHDAGWSYQDDGCGGSITDYSSYDEGVSYSEDAGDAKDAFVDLWNPVAESYGLSTRSRDEI
ncbi:hypothetical protein GCM10023194_20400 [Planotetraspora phitsanulokensis]|uniref:Uncharacterized protein n=1 Tax=Planotetraspora phitsanulokensis TaxID=575192 RepID=A0A8J3UB81_9ACTN|nr:hypothetical protein [Planotetraspora phitsanulokensis]GII39329.1 hypothetical protein Pph01_43320 [Planotetraspora phitsanulokensis]